MTEFDPKRTFRTAAASRPARAGFGAVAGSRNRNRPAKGLARVASRQPPRLRGFITVSSIKFLAGPIKDDTLQRAAFVGIRHAREPSARQFPISQECTF